MNCIDQGWSRYDHFAVLCELLPASLPSLVINLMVASLGGLQFGGHDIQLGVDWKLD